jgi:hypothetical protein
VTLHSEDTKIRVRKTLRRELETVWRKSGQRFWLRERKKAAKVASTET